MSKIASYFITLGNFFVRFQAGLVGVLFQQFRTPIFVSILYLGLSIAFHVWSLHVRWREPTSYWWTDGLQTLYVCQRFGGYTVQLPLSVKA